MSAVMLELHDVDLIPKYSVDESEIVSARIWVEEDEPELVHDYADDAGYDVVDDYATSETMEVEDDELEELQRVIFGDYDS